MRSKKIDKPFIFPEISQTCVRLHLNESVEVLPNAYVRDLKKCLTKEVLGQYPESNKLRQQIAQYAGVTEDQVLITAGSDQAIELLLQNYFENQRVTLQEPAFLAYRHLAKKYDVEIQSLDIQNFSTAEALVALDNTAGIIISNPGNPIGARIEKDDLVTIATAAEQQNKLCIVDEAYFEFLGETLVPSVAFNKKLIILRTFSKAFGLAGLRVGYLIAHKDIIIELQKLLLPCPISSFALLAASRALLHQKEFVKKRALLKKKKLVFEDALLHFNFKVLPTYTNFSNISIDDPESFAKNLKNLGIAIMPIQKYGIIRASIPQDPKKIARVLKDVRDLQNS